VSATPSSLRTVSSLPRAAATRWCSVRWGAPPLTGAALFKARARFVIQSILCQPRLTRRSAEGRTLQACDRAGTLALRNYNDGSWERWRLVDDRLLNQRWGTPLGLGLAIVCASLAADVQEAARRSARDARKAAVAVAAAEAAARHAGETARAEAGRGSSALERRLEAAEDGRSRANEEASAQRRAAQAAEARAAAAERALKDLRRSMAALETRAASAEEAAAAAAAERDRLESVLAQAVHAAQAAQAQALSDAALVAARSAQAAAPAVPAASSAALSCRYEPSPACLSEEEAEQSPRRLFSEEPISSAPPPQPPRWAASPAMQPLCAVPRAADPVPLAGPSPPESGASSGDNVWEGPAAKPEGWSVARCPPPMAENVVAKPVSAPRVQEPRYAPAREPLGLLAPDSKADLWMGLWQPMLGGETPAARGGPRRAAGMAAPRVHSWRVEEGSEMTGL
jgi:hypothetical protein